MFMLFKGLKLRSCDWDIKIPLLNHLINFTNLEFIFKQ